jgi:glutamate 5-kinase
MTTETTSQERELLVVKMGTDTVTNGKGLDKRVFHNIAHEVAELVHEGIRVVLVSSGAVGAGIPPNITEEQRERLRKIKPTVSTVGQRKLMDAFGYHFDYHDIEVAQWLTEPHDFNAKAPRKSMLQNFANLETLEEIYGKPIVPVINANDFATRAGFDSDNDRQAGSAVRIFPGLRKQLLLLTNKPGLLADVNEDSSVVRQIRAGEDDWRQYISEEQSENGTGSMLSKCEVAEGVALEQILASIGQGKSRYAIRDLLERKEGTIFLPPGYTE